MKNLLYIFILLLLVQVAIIQPGIANDTALSARGDNIGPFEGTPDIVLDEEIINLDVYSGKTIVNLTFYLRNEGPSQTILVGFPDEYASYEIPGQENMMISDIVGPINDFNVWVDGSEVKTSKKNQLSQYIVGDYPANFNVVWHVFPVEFKSGKTTVIKNSYWVKNGKNVMLERNFNYTIITGAKWKGNIGSTKIYANLKGGLHFGDIIKAYSTKGMVYINNNKAMWEFKNFEPSMSNGKGFFTITFKKNLIDDIRTRNLTEEDLEGMEPYELKLLRNEIYARHGRAFKTESLQVYFNSTDWYKENPHYSDSLLNTFEKRNASFILNYEKKIGSKIIYTD